MTYQVFCVLISDRIKAGLWSKQANALAVGMQRKRPLWLLHAMMLLASGLVATSFTVGKAIAGGMDPAVLTLIRFLIAVALFLPFIIRQHSLRLPDRKALFGYACISFALTGFFWLMFLSLRSTTALNTGVIFTLVPFLI